MRSFEQHVSLLLGAGLAPASAAGAAPAADAKDEEPDYRLCAPGNSLTGELRHKDFVAMCAGGARRCGRRAGRCPAGSVAWHGSTSDDTGPSRFRTVIFLPAEE